MRNHRVNLWATLLFALPLLAQNDKSASVEGTVTDSVSGFPVPHAHVTLEGGNGGPFRYGTTAGADGKFSVTGISPGPYWVEGQRVGYVSMSDPRSRTLIALKADDKKTDVELHLTPTGSITGRVTDSEGEPVESANVFAEGSRGGGNGFTDDKGQFRIGGLAPGYYSVRATRNEMFGGRPEIRTDGTAEVHNAETYYPGALTEKESGKVAVQAGGESTGIDIRLVQVPFVRVSGRVVEMLQHVEGGSLMLSQRNSRTGTRLEPDGSFETWRLSPGRYSLRAEWGTPNGERVHTTSAAIEVAGSNIDNIELRIVPDSDIRGRLEFEDDAAKQASEKAGADRRVTLGVLEEYGYGGSVAPVGVDDTFHLEEVQAGKYRVRVQAAGTYIKSMRLGGTAIDGAVLDLSSGSSGAELSLLLSAATGSVSGTVQDDSGPLAGLVVALLAAGTDGSFDLKEAPIKADGTYSFANVAPGNYKLVVAPQNDLVFRDNTLPEYEDQMLTIEVGTQEKVTKDLKRRAPTAQ